LKELVAEERTSGQIPTGIIAVGFYEANKKIGYNVIDIASGESMPLARTVPFPDTEIRAGKYYFSKTAFEFAIKALLNYRLNGVVFLDEAGPLELSGEGYADCLRKLLQAPLAKLYLSVREELLHDIMDAFFKGHNSTVISVR
jgi:nucleoside-triphosphatase